MSMMMQARRGGAITGDGLGGGDAFMPNLPGGMTEVFDTQFDTTFSIATPATEISYEGAFIGQDASNTEAAGSDSTTRASSDGGYGTHALRFRYAQGGLGDGNGPGKLRSATGLGLRQLYVAQRIKFSTGYELHTVGEKLVRPIITGNIIGAITEIYSSRAFSGLANPDAPFASISDDAVFSIGSWHTIEMYFQLNTPNNFDGTRKIWVDGTLVTNQVGTQKFYNGGTQLSIDSVQLECVRGGGASGVAVPTGGQWRDIDRAAVHGSVT